MKVPGQPEVNIGVVGHVDHGKSTLTERLTGERTDRHSEEIKRGISIRLGYADMAIYKCPKEPEPACYQNTEMCKTHNVKASCSGSYRLSTRPATRRSWPRCSAARRSWTARSS